MIMKTEGLKARALAATVVVALAFCGCSTAGPHEFGKPDVDAIKKLIQDFTTAYNAKDAAKVVTFFAGNAVLMPPNASTLHGSDAIQGYFVNRFAQGAKDLVIDMTDTSGVGQLAYTSGEYSLKLAPPNGPERPDRGKFLWVLRNFSGKWLLSHLIFSSDFPVSPSD
jgi:uncharacterized protein (TIGR02246 family)